MRVRITAVSLGRAGSSGKIGVTARQPFLGKLEWIDYDLTEDQGSSGKEDPRERADAQKKGEKK